MPEVLIQRVLALVDHAGILAAVAPSPGYLGEAEGALQVWMDCSGWEGRAVDCESAEALEDALAEAALVLLPDLADPAAYTNALGQTDAADFLLEALDAGTVLVAEGPAAEVLGEQVLPEAEHTWMPALRWMPGAIVQSHYTEGRSLPEDLQRIDRFRIGLPDGVVIVLGPGEEREIWGVEKPTITFREWWKT
jgi:hypothetical protein